MQHETGDADAEVCGPGLDHLALHVDLDQARGRDLVVKHSERVEQEVLRILTNADLKNNRRYLVMTQ